MKHIIKVEALENLPEIRPLIALDLNGSLRQYPYLEPGPVGPPNNEIWYTSVENVVVDLYESRPAGSLPEILSNTNENGKGVIKFASDLTVIGESAFRNCTHLTTVTIPSSVASIGNNAFDYCISLTSIEIPNSVTSIGNNAFDDCGHLTSVTLSNRLTSIGSMTFDTCSQLPTITIPSSVTNIGSYAFHYAGGGTQEDTFTVILESTIPMVLAGTTTGDYELDQFGNNIPGVDSDAALTILVPSEGYQSYISNTDIGWVYYRNNIQAY